MTLYSGLIDEIISRYGEQLSDMPKQTYDAINIYFANGLAVELHFANAEEYSINWQADEKEFRIDTAPLHPELSTFPNHLHNSSGELSDDPFTTPGNPPWDNVKTVLDSILKNPTPD